MDSSLPTFLSPKETYLIITNDPDKYIANIPEVAMFQRNAPDKETYKSLSARTAVGFTGYEKERLAFITGQVDRFIETQFKKKPKAPWVFAVTHGTYYEGGRPHVRFVDNRPIIFLSSVSFTIDVWEDACALGWSILYLRLAAVFPQETKWKEHLLREKKDWAFRDRWPQWCDIWYKAM